MVKVYEKNPPLWVYNGIFKLVDCQLEEAKGRKVFKFRLEITEGESLAARGEDQLDHTRMIPSIVKQEVWKRDKGQCVLCGTKLNLHYDHIIPYSKGGSSFDPENIRVLCARHNLMKHDRIE